jgi:predicted nucleic acid-binding Zn ribbon protein
MRGQRRTVASVLAQALAAKPAAAPAALAVAFAEACGPRLAREVSCRGLTREGKLLVLVTEGAWADQVRALEPELLARVAGRLGRPVAAGLEIRVGTA